MQEMGPGVYHFLFLCAIIPVYDSTMTSPLSSFRTVNLQKTQRRTLLFLLKKTLPSPKFRPLT